ncbi:MAG: hypothetical protein AAFY98_00380 [Verrucomicrobiota bacterium]
MKRYRSLIFVLSLCFCASALKASVDYEVVELAPVSGDLESHGISLNESGQSVGISIDLNGQPQAVRWDSTGSATPLITVGRPYSKALSINGAGSVVGAYTDSSNQIHACLWNASGNLSDLDSLIGVSPSEALSINDRGDIGGFYFQNGIAQGFVLTGGTTLELFSLTGAYSSRIYGLNQHGAVTGSGLSANDESGFIQSGFQSNSLPNLTGGQFGKALAVNNLGHSAGFSGQGEGEEVACCWVDGQVFLLGHLGGGQSHALGINNFGQVVGYSTTNPSDTIEIIFQTQTNEFDVPFDGEPAEEDQSNTILRDYDITRAFLWDGQTLLNLNDLIDTESGWVLLRAEDINDQGWITGYGIKDGDVRGFLLKPLNSPAELVQVSLPALDKTVPQETPIELQVNTNHDADEVRLYFNNQFQSSVSGNVISFNPGVLNFGAYTVKVETLDEQSNLIASRELTFTIRDLFLNEWKMRELASLSASEQSDIADPDLDGLNNITEFAFNLDPNDPDRPSSIPLSILFDNGDPCLSFKRRKAFSSQGLVYRIQESANLSPWDDADAQVTFENQVSDGDADPMETVLYRYTGSGDRRFFSIEPNSSN